MKKKIKRSHNGLWYWLAAIGLAFLLSCTSAKNTSTGSASFDSSYMQQLEANNQLLKKENETLQSNTNEYDYQSVVFDTSCNQALRDALSKAGLNTDSVMKVISALNNKVNFYADGSFSAEGKIKSAMRQRDKLQELLVQKDKAIDSVSALKQKTEIKIETRTEYKDKVVKRTWFPWWLLLVAYTAGVFFPPIKLFDKAKSLFAKK